MRLRGGGGPHARRVRGGGPDGGGGLPRRPGGQPLPGRGGPRAAATRGADALRRIASAHEGGRVLVVAHNTLLRLVLCELLSIPLADYRRVFPRLRNTAVTELRLEGNGKGAALLSLNVPCER